jgi:hypothetical protein
MAIAGRGSVKMLRWAVDIVTPAESIEEAVDLLQRQMYRPLWWRLLAAELRVIAKILRPAIKGRVSGFLPQEFFLVGWSKRDGCIKIFYAASENLSPLKFSTGDGYFAPALNPEEKIDLPRAGRSNPDAFPQALLNVIKRQRQLSLERERGEAIGGAAIITAISPQGIGQRVMYEWPDKTGDRWDRK